MDSTNFSPRKAAYEAAETYNLTRTTRDVLIEILSMAQRFKEIFPAIETLSMRARCSIRSVQRALKRLNNTGIIEITPQFRRVNGQIRQTTNRYRVTKCLAFLVPEIKKSISLSDLWQELVEKRSAESSPFNSLLDHAYLLGEANPKWIVIEWLHWWREFNPSAAFTLKIWKKALSGWIANKRDHFIY